MVSMTLNKTQLRELVKEAVTELLQERRSLMRELIAEVIEDIALSRAIDEGEKTPIVSREEVLKALDRE
ncbi:MAG: hypothetical protein FJ291_26150 [Planctomycetes bacterium]|nr:hypothetical protein [Planctomycetota bacterium]